MKSIREEVSVMCGMDCLERDYDQMKREYEDRNMDVEKYSLQPSVICSDSKKRVVSSSVSVADRRGYVWMQCISLSCREVEVLSRRFRLLKRQKKRGID